MNTIKLNKIRNFYMDITDHTGGCMLAELQESLLEYMLFEDETSSEALVKAFLTWYKSLPDAGKLELAHLVDALTKIIYLL